MYTILCKWYTICILFRIYFLVWYFHNIMYLKNKTVVVHFVTLSLHYHEDYYTHNIVSSEFVEEKGQLLNGSLKIPKSKFNYI